ncbi:MAG TPA: tyrosine--tRNA ligase, partial [Acholeplasmataceae bacterium]|nr:tyrosine--tRNA ligase [Acholeplasmataceae bacterium]
KETVQKRLETGISYTEFSYMILQSIDWLHLYQNHDVKIQFGGSDQWGNLTSGLELIRRVVGKNDAVGLSSPLLLKADGTKFGKSESGAIWLDENLTSPYEMYQYFLNSSDEDIETYLKLLTLKEKEEIDSILSKHQEKPELRFAQKALAEDVVTLVHGKKALENALKVTDALFSGNFNDLSLEAYNMLARVLDVLKVTDQNFIELIVQSKLASSNREAREFVLNGAISINGVKIEDIAYDTRQIPKAFDRYSIIRRGKKKYALLVFK